MAFETEFDLVCDTIKGALEAGQVLTVSEVNARVEQRLESDPALQFVRVLKGVGFFFGASAHTQKKEPSPDGI